MLIAGLYDRLIIHKTSWANNVLDSTLKVYFNFTSHVLVRYMIWEKIVIQVGKIELECYPLVRWHCKDIENLKKKNSLTDIAQCYVKQDLGYFSNETRVALCLHSIGK